MFACLFNHRPVNSISNTYENIKFVLWIKMRNMSEKFKITKPHDMNFITHDETHD